MRPVLNKNHGASRDLWRKRRLRRRFAERLDALGAENLFDHPSFFHHRHLLQVGLERAIGGALRERTIVTEGGRFAAGTAFSHFEHPFKYNDADNAF